MQRKSKPVTWRFKGSADALDASTSFDGAMMALTNLIPDPTTSRLWQCRPAAIKTFDLNTQGGPFSSGFSSGFQHSYFNGTAGFISVFKVIGDIVYGMAADSNFPGQDAPFAYDLATGSALLVGGSINATTLPTSPAASGAWTPPQMALIGTKLMVAHSGFTGAGGNFIGWFDISLPTNPTWNAGNLSGAIQFTVAPTGVANFFNRAYYIHNALISPAVIFSDVLAATTATNSTQALTFGDNVPLTALGGLPLFNTSGGIVQSLMVFKNVTNIYQVTGDAAITTNPLSVNTLNIATGTLAPNSVCSTPKGLAFISPDGLRIIDFSAKVSDPIGEDGHGITVPFISTSVPTRMVVGCNGNVLRASTLNGAIDGSPAQEYWFDFARNIWTGPHTFPASLIEPWKNTFIMTPNGITGSLWQSDYVQTLTSSFVENGANLTWVASTPLLPDTDQMTNVCITEMTMDFSVAANIGNVTMSLINEMGAVLDTMLIAAGTASQTLWGQFVWGQARWGGGSSFPLAPYRLEPHLPLVFNRASFSATAPSALGMKVGALHLRYQVLRQWIAPPFSVAPTLATALINENASEVLINEDASAQLITESSP